MEPRLGKRPPAHPIGAIQLLCSISFSTGEVTPGITDFPRVGAAVYSAHPDLLSRVAEFVKLKNPDKLILSLATFAKDPTTLVKLTPEKLFGTHIAILGATDPHSKDRMLSFPRHLNPALFRPITNCSDVYQFNCEGVPDAMQANPWISAALAGRVFLRVLCVTFSPW